ncbi:unnamed protein product [Linum tenue]|uniref:Leucine-rich repeat-containing N-terminal plant-type domain-containing protein n=1 Tax=Linum tenue TaxID=586396 RepID=A0AAV0I9M5_9ROSI|nr:unnamed protein product [Linum tenue]
MQEIKKGITHDPDGVFNSCNDSLHFCSWLGVLCDRCESDERVTSLLLPELNLEGTLPPHIGNLSFMNSISHANNRFHGQIPPQLGSFVRLQQLNLSENTIDGAIPVNLSHCSKLKILSLQINRLQGTIHEELGMEKYKWGGKKPSECLESESRWTQKGGGELGIGCRQRRTRETGWLERGREDAHDDCRRKRVVIAERFDVASIIFVDLPVLTGFSYARTEAAALSSDNLQIDQAVEFLRKWLKEHEEFKSNPVYIGGDSYAGIPVPGIALRISDENEQGLEPAINLEGYLVGNGRANATIEDNSRIKFAHGMALISDELYESLRRSCGGEYYNVDPGNSECLKHVRDFKKCTSGLESAQILLPKCTYASPKPPMMVPRRSRSLQELLELEAASLPRLGCPTFAYLLSKYWANDEGVQTALHVRKGTIGTWERCSSRLHYTTDVASSTEFHLQLARKGYRSLIYSGDHDMLVPYVGTLEWIRSLNFRIVEEWRHWLLNNQVAGYTRTYSDPRYYNLMTFATVKDTRLLNTSPPNVMQCSKDGLQANHSN